MNLIDSLPQPHPIPTTDFERGCFERINKDNKNSEAARNELVMANIREALLYVRRTSNSQLPDDELLSLCYKELQMAAGRFNPRHKTRFFAFAKAGLRGRVKLALASRDVVRNSKGILSLDADTGGVTCGPEADYGKRPVERHEIAEDSEDPEFSSIFARDEWQLIKAIIRGKVTDRERLILTLTYTGGLNFPEIAKLLGVSRAGIHLIHKKAIAKIRDEISRDGRLLKDRQ